MNIPSCWVCSRTRTSTTKLQNITFHRLVYYFLLYKINFIHFIILWNKLNFFFDRFPSNQVVLEKWYDFLRKSGLDVSNIKKHSLICSTHFDSHSFIKHNNYRTLLINRVKNVSWLWLSFLNQIYLLFYLCRQNACFQK